MCFLLSGKVIAQSGFEILCDEIGRGFYKAGVINLKMNLDKLHKVVQDGFYTYVSYLTFPLARDDYFRGLGCEVKYSSGGFGKEDGFVSLSIMSYGKRGFWHIKMSNEIAERILVLGLP